MAAPPPSLAERALRPFQEFARRESSSGLVLIACTIVALGWANSPWSRTYHALWDVDLSIGVGGFVLRETVHHWINDGLMAVFFFVIGLEIKREVLVGELAAWRRAALPLAAAIGGIVVPALLYLTLNAGTPGAAGWGIPMATDIAFALGVLALLGPRVPTGLKVFLTGLAIIDDISAVLVIAVVYTAGVSAQALGWAGGFLVLLVGCNRAGVRHPAPYVVLGVALWAAVLESGIHATIAGVLLALTIPARTRIDAGEFLARGRQSLEAFAAAGVTDADLLTSTAHQEELFAIESAAEQAQAPLLRLEHGLHGLVAFGIMPLFALANAGVSLTGGADALTGRIALGTVLGLVVGKPLGVTLFTWLAVQAGVAERPAELSWRALHGAAWLAGIGFTMSLFIAALAFTDPAYLAQAKIGVLTASLVAGATGWLLLRRLPAPSHRSS